MQIVIPVKHLEQAKARLAAVCSPGQRRELSRLMLRDMLKVIAGAEEVNAVHIVSNDQDVCQLAGEYNAGFIATASDTGFSEDAMQGIAEISAVSSEPIVVLPADLPQLSKQDLGLLNTRFSGGLLACPAVVDGGTNALMFEPPLPFPLVFGENSLDRFKALAREAQIPLAVEHIKGLERDMDRPEDLAWLAEQQAGGETWAYVRREGLGKSSAVNSHVLD